MRWTICFFSFLILSIFLISCYPEVNCSSYDFPSNDPVDAVIVDSEDVYEQNANDRLDVLFNSQWKFAKSDIPNAKEVGFDDSSWETIELPHTWNNIDGQDGGGDYYRGIGWYRKQYNFLSEFSDKKIFIKFEAANIITDLYVNGVHAGQHKGGYAAFTFDVTELVNFEQENVFAVKVDNSEGINIAPLAGDFTFCGGIYRPVHLLVTNKVHISPLDYGSPGIYLKQSNVSETSADLSVITKAKNDSGEDLEVTVCSVIRDANDSVVYTLTSTKFLPEHSTYDFGQPIEIENPKLWNGKEDPYLYKVEVKIKLGNTVVDIVEQPLGFRFFHVDKENGFFLNGKKLSLHGVAMHEDRKDKGRAISDNDREEDISLIEELGCNFVRLAHYQHAEKTYRLCDEKGLVVWTEIPLINKISTDTEFSDNTENQLKELIRQNYNHPSICFWGIFNEITFAFGHNPKELIKKLHCIAENEDHGRLTTAASYASYTSLLGTILPNLMRSTNWITDLIAFNKYWGWYYGTYNDFTPWMNIVYNYLNSHNYRTEGVGISEYGAGANIMQYDQDPQPPGTLGAFGNWHPEAYQSLFHEYHWLEMKNMEYLWCTAIWACFDFASDSRNEGDMPGINDKGIITHDRKVKKDSFFWYRANWSDEPTVYITGRRFLPSIKNSTIDVKVYSNCDSVELFVNNMSQGSMESDDRIYIWNNVFLPDENNLIEAVGICSGMTYNDSVQ